MAKVSRDLAKALVDPSNKDEVVLLYAQLKPTDVRRGLLNGLISGNDIVAAFNAESKQFARRVKSCNGMVMHHTFGSKRRFSGESIWAPGLGSKGRFSSPICSEDAVIALPVRALMSLADDPKVVALRYAKPVELVRFYGAPGW